MKVLAAKETTVKSFVQETNWGCEMEPELKLLSESEVAELRAMPGVTFPARFRCEVELSEADAVREGISPLPAGARLTDFERPVVDGLPGAVLSFLLFDGQVAQSRQVSITTEGTGHEALHTLVGMGRVVLLSEDVVA